VTLPFLDSNNNVFDKQKMDDPLGAWRQLTLNIIANPQNIKLHTQRIMLAMDPHLQPYLSGALQDVFITLQAKGRPLKEKLFNLASPLLESNIRSYFKQWLDENSDAMIACVPYPGSVLSSDNCNKSTESDSSADDIAALDNFLSDNYDNTIDRVRYCVAYGDIDHAQKILELEITLAHNNSQQTTLVEQELLSIYYHSKNKSALDKMSDSLLKNNKVLSADWKKVQSIANEW